MIFTSDFVTRENHWQSGSLVTQKSLFTVTHALFFIYIDKYIIYIDGALPNQFHVSTHMRTTFPIIYFSYLTVHLVTVMSLLWRHSRRDGVSNHQPHDCLLNRLFRRRSKKTSKLRVTGLCAGNSPVTGEFPAQMASNAENVSIWWRHHAAPYSHYNMIWFRYSSFDRSAIVQYTFKVV